MSALTVRQRQALRYADIQNTARHDMRAAESEFRATVVRLPVRQQTPASSESLLQRWFERAGWFLFLLVGLAIFALSACGEFRPRPDLKVSTLTQSSVSCVHGHKTEPVGTMGPYDTPVVLVTAERCEVRP
ncbi:hypothetical protein [Luteibacter sp. SG786]|uniref:hypothetical protein n=1 Tax=Luteibacter sp. SG786 TaxID=2587130 RepID=UPI00141E29B1|nr:hypothetical protein [Luteibacter sp. SG786]NII53550.1 hypothetical protein [Luteibacter sp. SG786]